MVNVLYFFLQKLKPHTSFPYKSFNDELSVTQINKDICLRYALSFYLIAFNVADNACETQKKKRFVELTCLAKCDNYFVRRFDLSFALKRLSDILEFLLQFRFVELLKNYLERKNVNLQL